MLIPDESVIPTLARISRYEKIGSTWIIEQNKSVGEGNQFQNFRLSPHECGGRYRREACVLSLLDLPTLLSSGKFIGNIHISRKYKMKIVLSRKQSYN